MIHRLARKHYFEIEKNRYPLSPITHDPSITYLNLNINSLSSEAYKFYPKTKNHSLANQYIKTLLLLSNIDEKTSSLSEKNILFSQGSTEAIDLIIRTFCEPKEEFIQVTSPTFPYYAYRAMIENVSVIDIPLEGEDLNKLNIEQILSNPGKVLFLCSPNNPTGTALDLKQLEEIISQFPGIIVFDEAYAEWNHQPTCAEWIKKYDNLIILRTLSKIWGLAGVRCGITITNENIIDTLSFAQTMFSFPSSSADLVSKKLKETDQILSYCSKVAELRRDFLQFLSSLSFVEKVYPGVANFIFAKYKNASAVESHLRKTNILVSNTSSQVPQTLRISIGTEEEMLRLQSALKEFNQER